MALLNKGVWLLEPVKLGGVEKEILTLLAKNKGGLKLKQILMILKKEHFSYVSRPLNTLIEKGLVSELSKDQPRGRGRPARTFGVTTAGVGRYIHETDDFSVLGVQRGLDPLIAKLHDFYEALEGYKKRDEIMRGLISVSLMMVKSGLDVDDVINMGGAWMERRLSKLPNKYKKRVLAVSNGKLLKRVRREFKRQIEA